MIQHARWIALLVVGAGACAPGRPSSAPSAELRAHWLDVSQDLVDDLVALGR